MKEKDKINIGVIIIIILIVLCIGLGAFIFCNRDKFVAKENTKIEEKVEKETEKKDDVNTVSEEDKAKLNKFIEIASIDDTITSKVVTATYFNKGVSYITKEVKLKMAYNVTYNLGTFENYVLTEDEINKIPEEDGIKNDKTYIGEKVTVIKVSDFENAYKEFFDEEPSYTLDDLSELGCPRIQAIDRGRDKIYLFSRCGGTTIMSYDTEIISYEKDDNYYLVHQKAKKYNKATSTVEEEYNILWKFDKNLKFVSTELE